MARFSVRGDLIHPGVHYDPTQTQFPTTYKASARLLFAIAAAHGWPIEHMDISNSYVQEPAMCRHTFYALELKQIESKAFLNMGNPRACYEETYGEADPLVIIISRPSSPIWHNRASMHSKNTAVSVPQRRLGHYNGGNPIG